MPLTETLQITLDISGRLKFLKIPYAVGGSVASSLYGIPRATQDIDILIKLYPAKVSALADSLKNDYYVDEDAVRYACETAGSFNVIHLASMFKIDFFAAGEDELLAQEFMRVKTISIGSDPHAELVVADAADMIIQKLLWYKDGGEISERQWRDILGMITVAADDIDWHYVYKWVKKKSLLKLLNKVLKEADVKIAAVDKENL
jgi:hypothetical protein